MSTFGLTGARMSPSEKEQPLPPNISVSAIGDKSSRLWDDYWTIIRKSFVNFGCRKVLIRTFM